MLQPHGVAVALLAVGWLSLAVGWELFSVVAMLAIGPVEAWPDVGRLDVVPEVAD